MRVRVRVLSFVTFPGNTDSLENFQQHLYPLTRQSVGGGGWSLTIVTVPTIDKSFFLFTTLEFTYYHHRLLSVITMIHNLHCTRNLITYNNNYSMLGLKIGSLFLFFNFWSLSLNSFGQFWSDPTNSEGRSLYFPVRNKNGSGRCTCDQWFFRWLQFLILAHMRSSHLGH